MGVVASAHGRIEVDPDVLINAGKRVGSLGSQLAMLSDSLGSALASGLAAGNDTAGLSFALEYGRSAQRFAETLAVAANAYKSVGYMLEATGYNYKNADAASTIGGPGPAGGLGPAPAETTAGDMPTGPNGIMVPPPTMWYVIEPLLQALPGIGLIAGMGMTWPSGHAALMNVVAAQWRNFATGFAIFQSELNALTPGVAAQNIPEGRKIAEAFKDLGDRMNSLATASSGLADAITNFAGEVQQTQDAIRRLMDRLSLSGLWDTVTDFFNGDGMKVVREVARDVGTVLGNFQRQVKGIVGLLTELKNLISDAADAFEKWVRPVLVAQFGDGVGNFLADAATLYTDFEVGIANGLINTVSGVVSMADPEMWEGLAKTAWAVANNPETAPGVLAEMGKQFIALDQWKGDHPGRGAGEAAFNIGSLFVPGGALSKTGSVAKSLNMGRRIVEEGRLPKLGEIGQWSRGAPRVEGLDNLPGGQAIPDVPEVRAGAVPDALVGGPPAPHGIETPPAPRGFEGPSGPPDPPGPQSTPGPAHEGAGSGDGPPPDPPGRSVPPADAGPGRADAPESPSPTGTHDAPSTSPETPPAPTPHAPDPGTHSPQVDSRPVDHRSDPSVGETHMPARNDAPAAGYTPPEHHGGAPAERQPAHQPAAGQPDAREPDGTPADRDAGQHAVTQTPVVAGGMPMAPHAGGGMHNAADAPSRTPIAETRAPESRAPQGGSPESPRAQAPAGAGPSTERSPSAPLKPAGTPSLSEAASEPVRRAPESGTSRPGDSSPAAPSHEPPAAGDRLAHQPDPSNSGHDPNAGSGHGQHPDHSSDEPHIERHDRGNLWDNPVGEHAAGLLPVDDSGYRIQPKDCEFLGITPQNVEDWASRAAPLGMTPEDFREFTGSLYDALSREGFSPTDLDVRLQGSSARFFSGEHKWLPTESELASKPDAKAIAESWFGDDEGRPLRRPFDSMFRLGLDDEPSDYDLQISSDFMVEACRERWQADGSPKDFVHPKYGFINKRIFEKMFPALWDWAEEWTQRTGRPVVPALFPSAGPPNTDSTGVSSHFRDSDWHISPEGGGTK